MDAERFDFIYKQSQSGINYQEIASSIGVHFSTTHKVISAVNRLTSQINGLDQGNRNTNDGIALAQTIEGALDETNNMMQRIRTLAVQAANGTYTQDDRDALQQEVTQLCQEISRIAEKTTFAGARVLDGAEANTLHWGALDKIRLQNGNNVN